MFGGICPRGKLTHDSQLYSWQVEAVMLACRKELPVSQEACNIAYWICWEAGDTFCSRALETPLERPGIRGQWPKVSVLAFLC